MDIRRGINRPRFLFIFVQVVYAEVDTEESEESEEEDDDESGKLSGRAALLRRCLPVLCNVFL